MTSRLVMGWVVFATSFLGACDAVESPGVAQQASRVTYLVGTDTRVELVIHGNGRIASQQAWRIDETGRRTHADGLAREWFTNGAIASERAYQDGKLDGPRRSWFADGTLLGETEYRAGRKHGLERMWNANGELVSRAVWENGRRGAHERTGARAPELDRVTVANVFGTPNDTR